MDTGAHISTTPIAPSRRTSATPGRSRQPASPVIRPRSIRAMLACQSEASRRAMLALAIAQASGLPMKVGPCMKTPGSPDEMVRATRSVARVAASVT